MSGSSVGNDLVLVVSVVVDDAGHRLPAVLDVVEVAPDVASVDDGRVVGLEKKASHFLVNWSPSCCMDEREITGLLPPR